LLNFLNKKLPEQMWYFSKIYYHQVPYVKWHCCHYHLTNSHSCHISITNSRVL